MDVRKAASVKYVQFFDDNNLLPSFPLLNDVTEFEQIYTAAKNLDERKLERCLLLSGMSIHCQQDGRTLIARLIQEKAFASVEWLMKWGANRSEVIKQYILMGQTMKVRELLQAGTIDEKLFGYACLGDKEHVIEMLSVPGADIASAMRGAIYGCREEIVSILLDFVGETKEEWMPIVLHAIYAYAHENRGDRVESLLQYTKKENCLVKALDQAVRGYACEGYHESVTHFLKQGASVIAAIRGYAFSGNVEKVEALIKNLSDKQAGLDAAVYGYARGGHIRYVEMCIKKGASMAIGLQGLKSSGYLSSLQQFQQTLIAFNDKELRYKLMKKLSEMHTAKKETKMLKLCNKAITLMRAELQKPGFSFQKAREKVLDEQSEAALSQFYAVISSYGREDVPIELGFSPHRLFYSPTYKRRHTVDNVSESMYRPF